MTSGDFWRWLFGRSRGFVRGNWRWPPPYENRPEPSREPARAARHRNGRGWRSAPLRVIPTGWFCPPSTGPLTTLSRPPTGWTGQAIPSGSSIRAPTDPTGASGQLTGAGRQRHRSAGPRRPPPPPSPRSALPPLRLWVAVHLRRPRLAGPPLRLWVAVHLRRPRLAGPPLRLWVAVHLRRLRVPLPPPRRRSALPPLRPRPPLPPPLPP